MKSNSRYQPDWLNTRWRPMMGWTYMITCIFDFILAPILWSIVQAIANGGVVATQWSPLTLQGAGLYHVAMGAVLGITAWSRGQEKIAAATDIVAATVKSPVKETYQEEISP